MPMTTNQAGLPSYQFDDEEGDDSPAVEPVHDDDEEHHFINRHERALQYALNSIKKGTEPEQVIARAKAYLAFMQEK